MADANYTVSRNMFVELERAISVLCEPRYQRDTLKYPRRWTGFQYSSCSYHTRAESREEVA